jgi:hypothetical protein
MGYVFSISVTIGATLSVLFVESGTIFLTIICRVVFLVILLLLGSCLRI